MFDLAGKVALVTGGNGGIGLGMARGLAGAGATVVLAGRNAEKSSQAVAELKVQGVSADAIEADVTDEHQVARLFQEVMVRHGRLDILVNNAGSTIREALNRWEGLGLIDAAIVPHYRSDHAEAEAAERVATWMKVSSTTAR